MNSAYYLLLFLYFIEYVGLYKYIPLIKSLHISSIIALYLFIYTFFKKGYKEILYFKDTKLLIIFLTFSFITITYALVTIRAYQEARTHLAYFLLFLKREGRI